MGELYVNIWGQCGAWLVERYAGRQLRIVLQIILVFIAELAWHHPSLSTHIRRNIKHGINPLQTE